MFISTILTLMVAEAVASGAAAVNWVGVAGFAFTVLLQVVSVVWLLAKQSSSVEKLTGEMADHKLIPDRVSKLEWEVSQTKDMLKELRDSNQKINSQLQEMNLLLHSLAERFGAAKKAADEKE